MLFHSLSNGRTKSGFNAPAASQSFIESVPMNTQFDCPFSNGQAHSIMLDAPIRSSVIRLLFSCRPSAVLFRITTVVVYSLKRHAIGALAHIKNKLLKTFPPFLAYFDATRTVILIKLMLRSMASALDILPNGVKAAFAFAVPCVRLVKIFCSCAASFAMQTPTRLRHACFKMVAPHIFPSATIAEAQTISADGFDNKTAKSLANKNWVNFLTGHKISFGCPLTLNPNAGDVNHGF